MSFLIGKDILKHDYRGSTYDDHRAGRLKFLQKAFCFLFAVFAARTLQLAMQQSDYIKYFGLSDSEIERRADIVDRNGVVLAKSVKSGDIKLIHQGSRNKI